MSEWPKTVRSGSVTVKIYQHKRGAYSQHIVTYYLGKKRVRKVVTDFASAKKEAERVSTKIKARETWDAVTRSSNEVPQLKANMK